MHYCSWCSWRYMSCVAKASYPILRRDCHNSNSPFASMILYLPIIIYLFYVKDPRLNKSVKPPILSCFGDIALAICGEFSKYLNVVMNILLQAARFQVDKVLPFLVYELNLRVNFRAMTKWWITKMNLEKVFSRP